ncbi:MBL fold metallo-hydrolase [Thioalkalivibrio denitrificans]|uniref:MBL fold metallo-hydrolase n=1 Tax=Thioalkalivibrio denitrificans TaxID=108003 RepID=A0A1V3NE06_9GAMM|nr:MBL fold metallo-hydrolase [Thioalkalivibrio denitrificans]
MRGVRFASLGSGSRGNGLVICTGRTRVMVDCGFSVSEVVRRLARLSMTPDSIDAVLITHEHSDHVGGAAAFSRRFAKTVWLTAGTLNALRDTAFHATRIFHAHQRLAIGDLQVEPYPVPHDAREPCQFMFSDGDKRLGLLTDAGSVTPHMQRTLDGCDALLLECNHDAQMLAAGPYPEPLKRRVGGGLGHLANHQAEALLAALDTSRLRHVIGMHLSEKNNTEALALESLSRALGCTPDWLDVARQDEGFGWRVV